MLIIPAIDLKDGKCVRLYRGRMEEVTIYSAKPAEIARRWEDAGARLIHLVDLDGAIAGEPQNWRAIERVVEAVEVPVQFGGGVRSEETLERLLGLGVSRAVVGTQALADPDFLRRICGGYGDRIVVGLDVRGGKVVVRGWEEASDRPYLDLAREVEEAGARRLIYTDTERDGALEGPDIEGLSRLLEAVSIPVIASGGVTTVRDVEALVGMDPGPEGAIIGKALYEGVIRLEEAIEVAEAVAG